MLPSRFIILSLASQRFLCFLPSFIHRHTRKTSEKREHLHTSAEIKSAMQNSSRQKKKELLRKEPDTRKKKAAEGEEETGEKEEKIMQSTDNSRRAREPSAFENKKLLQI
jgi:hypothetical protein